MAMAHSSHGWVLKELINSTYNQETASTCTVDMIHRKGVASVGACAIVR